MTKFKIPNSDGMPSAMQISYKELSMLISKYFDHYF